MGRLAFALLFAIAAMAVAVPPAQAQTAGQGAQEAYAQSARPRIIIRPRRLGPNAKRYCRTRLVQENRLSGTVIVPHTTCWWR
jgi:hypothetical protein